MAQMHQRMGFYVAPNGRLLVLGFYGIPRRPNDGRGVGRVVREVLADGSFGPVFFIRDNRHRWPLAMVTGDDGIEFDDLLVVQGEVPVRRYNGLDKAFGPQYVRGGACRR
mgnify:CR=1 FL=1